MLYDAGIALLHTPSRAQGYLLIAVERITSKPREETKVLLDMWCRVRPKSCAISLG
jgi:hypothetical protein